MLEGVITGVLELGAAGTVEDGSRRFFLTAAARVTNERDLMQLPVADNVVLADVADVERTLALRNDNVFLNGRRAVRLAMRCPPPVVALHPDDAAALGLGDGTDVAVDGKSAARLIVDPSIPRGHVGASVGRILPRGLSRRVRVEARR